ncbi:MAG: hypothetical protein JWQ94_385 [Tardiphaga sp.]|nr:hypothetical protein [Tardiphaga sp.]
MTVSRQFIVAKDDLHHCRLIERSLPSLDQLPEEALLVEVERFAFTANNITYAMLGDEMKYWQLFPAPDGFGNIPVWGFGAVVASRHPQIETGERLFGYFPMATHLVIEATDVSRRGLRDAAAHRRGVAPVYNAYARVGSDAAFAGRHGDYQALLRPLFMLSFLVDDYLAEHHFFSAEQVMLTSASSKAAIGLAHLLQTQRQPIRVIGLTSAANTEFVASLGCYHEVISYDRIDALPADQLAAFVDFAGSSALRRHVHRQFGDRLVCSTQIGLTHQDAAEQETDLPGAAPSWFFAPDQIRKRAKEWGPGGIDQRLGAAWAGFLPRLERWIEVVESSGPAAVERLYRDTLAGRVSPRHGHMLALWPVEAT